MALTIELCFLIESNIVYLNIKWERNYSYIQKNEEITFRLQLNVYEMWGKINIYFPIGMPNPAITFTNCYQDLKQT